MSRSSKHIFKKNPLLFPSEAIKKFNLPKSAVKSVHEDFAKNSLRIDFYIALVVGLTMIFYIIQDLITYKFSGFSDRIRSDPFFYAADFIFLIDSIVLIIIALAFIKNGKNTSIHRAATDIFKSFLAVAMICFLIDDASSGQLDKAKAIAPCILWMPVICICPLAFLLDNIIINAGISVAMITAVNILNNISDNFHINEIHQYWIVAVVYFFTSIIYHNVFFHVEAMKYNFEHENAELLVTSSFDPLTNCWNRNGMHSYTKPFEGNPLVKDEIVVMMDVDNFKKFNDRYSHLEGDTVLREVSHSLLENFLAKGAHVCRFGGDEFVLITAIDSEEDARKYLILIQDVIRSINLASLKNEDKITLSIGCTYLKQGTVFNFSDAVASADEQLYKAKNSGRNCICFQGSVIR